jgi:acyl carrier protein
MSAMIDDKLTEILKDNLSEPDGGFTESTVLKETGASSLSTLEIAIAVEQQYKLDGDGTIEDEDIFALATVGDLQDYIARRTAVHA